MHIFDLPELDPLPLLDQEFDKVDITPEASAHNLIEPTLLCDDLAWDDQLDSGLEMSL